MSKTQWPAHYDVWTAVIINVKQVLCHAFKSGEWRKWKNCLL